MKTSTSTKTSVWLLVFLVALTVFICFTYSRENSYSILEGFWVRSFEDIGIRLHTAERVRLDITLAKATWNKTSSIPRYLQDSVQRSFASVQYPESCDGAKFLVCDLKGLKSGYGSRLQHVILCHVLAYSLGRVLVLRNSYFDGLHNYVMPLHQSDACYNKTVDPEIRLINQQLWNEEGQFNNKPSSFVFSVFELRRGLFPPYLPGTTPRKIAVMLEKEGIDPGHWYIGQSAYFLAGRFQPSFLEEVERFKKETQLSHPMVGIHIRHSDKVFGVHREAKFISALDYMVPVEKYFNAHHPNITTRNVYVATDDPEAVTVLRKNFTTGYRFVGLTSNVSAEAGHENHFTFYKTTMMRGLMLDLAVIINSDFVVCTLSSNLGRLIHEIRQASFRGETSLRDQLASLDAAFAFAILDLQYFKPRLIAIAKRDVKADTDVQGTFAELKKGAWYEINAKHAGTNDTMIYFGANRGYVRREDIHMLPMRTEITDPLLETEIEYLETLIDV